MTRILKAVGLFFLVACMGFCGLVNFVNAPQKQQREVDARRAADEIVRALAAYREAEQAYPDRLEELIPRHLASIDAPSTDGRFEYRRSEEGDGFHLGYPEAPMGALPSDGYYSYEASSGDWSFALR